MNIIDGYTNLFGIIGNPIHHSLSPAMYNYSFTRLGINAIYLAFELSADDAGAYVNSVRTLNIKGGNVTMPFKASILPFLDELSKESEIIGAVNTIVNNNGKIKGYNTDGKGLVLAIKSKNATVAGKTICIFGAGGTANSILYSVCEEGASKIYIVVRKTSSTDLVKKTIAYLNQTKPECQISFVYFDETDSFESCVKQSDIIINATPIGMYPEKDKTPVSNTLLLSPDKLVADAVYNPRVTKLLSDAASAGCSTVSGLDMLLWQAVESFYLFADGAILPVDEVAKEIFDINLEDSSEG